MESINAKRFYTLGFSLLPNIGPARFKKIISVFESPEAAWKASTQEYEAKKFSPDIIQAVAEKRPLIRLDQEWEKLGQEGVSFIDQNSNRYPRLLKEIHHPPIGLFVRGTIPAYHTAVAVVGTRRASHYGFSAVKTITAELARQGVAIISGMAMGIDTAAHKAALENKGTTIAVLGSSVDKASFSSSWKQELVNHICTNGGAVLSEYPIGAPVLTHHFPMRNRIISGLAQGTLVVEGDLTSGALITSKFALEQNREVFAVPGNITNPYSAGPNALIKQGARPVTAAEDILDALNIPITIAREKAKKIFPSSPDEKTLFALINNEPTHVDDITRSSGLDTKLVNSTLTLMEMKGIVRHIGGGMYTKETL